jgi:YD repeat-containing protein
MGNLTGYDDGVTSAVYGYDETYRKVSEAVDYGDFTLSNMIEYFNDGRKKTFTGPDNVTYQYQYDTGGRLAGVQIPDVGFVTIGNYTWNRPTRVTLPGGTEKEYEYDPLMRVKRITSRDPGQNVLLNFEYTRDKMDNITGKNTGHGDYGYQYDDLYRLTAVDNPEFSDEAFSYDGVGNRLTSAEHADWTYNANNELISYDGVSYEYDANGNMVKKTDGGVVTSFVNNI